MYKLEPACWDDFRATFLKELTDETTPNTRVNPISGISMECSVDLILFLLSFKIQYQGGYMYEKN